MLLISLKPNSGKLGYPVFKLLKLRLVLLLLFFQFSLFAQNGGLVNGKIPIDYNRWYQLNNVSNDARGLFDGILNANVNFGYGLVLNNWDMYYPVLKGEIIQIDKIRMYDWEGVFTDQPVTIYAVDDKFQRTVIGRFTGPSYDRWVGPYVDSPDVYNLITPVTNIKYIQINTYGPMPSELEFYGNYQSPDPIIFKQPTVKINNLFGTNGFEWNVLQTDGYDINPKSMGLAKKAFTGFRHYLNWGRVETSEGGYTYNPSFSGSWNLDTIYSSFKQANIEVLVCIQSQPGYMLNTYPPARQNAENVPVKFGKDFSLPQSYIEMGKMAFQFAARYGANADVNRALLSVNSTPRWTNDPPNIIKTGLNLVKYMECNNETDKWWKGRDAYQTGREYAANLSVFYDGHKNSMGTGVGAKNADPSMLIVAAGTASATPDYIRGMVDWCAEFRGYLPNGTVNYCWDVINFHFYSNDANDSQHGYATKGVAPEVGGLVSVATKFINTANQYVSNQPVWLTEIGYDLNPLGSAQFAQAIGNRTVQETQGDWSLRSILLAARIGLERVFFYEMYDDNPFGGQFATSGFLNDSTLRPAADFSNQVIRNFGNYVFKENLAHNPEVDRYEYLKQSMYAVWMPTQSASTKNISLEVGKMDSVSIYFPKTASDTMLVARATNTMSTITLTATETPQFLIPHLHLIDLLDFKITGNMDRKVDLSWIVSQDTTVQSFAIEKMKESDKTFYPLAIIQPNAIRAKMPTYTFKDTSANLGFNHYRLKILLSTYSYFYSGVVEAFVGKLITYPNPFTQSITIQGLAGDRSSTLSIYSLGGLLVKTATVNGKSYQWNLNNLASGVYYLVADDGISKQKYSIHKMPKN